MPSEKELADLPQEKRWQLMDTVATFIEDRSDRRLYPMASRIVDALSLCNQDFKASRRDEALAVHIAKHVRASPHHETIDAVNFAIGTYLEKHGKDDRLHKYTEKARAHSEAREFKPLVRDPSDKDHGIRFF